MDDSIDFSPGTWNLSFLNSIRFNFYPSVAGNRLRDRLPLAATWTGWLRATAPRVVVVEYVGEGSILIGSRSLRLAPSYAQSSHLTVTVPGGDHRVLMTYTFDDGSRVGQPIPGPYAAVHVSFQDPAGRPADVALSPPIPCRTWWKMAGWLADGLVLLLGASLAVFYGRLLARDGWWGGACSHSCRPTQP